ncbi:MAG: hypothetical protein N2Z21_05530, partial [Candidatus Sumerlaeaceae bacterium]|nr:hypothetical protein [Candidatus Sumerlaeaceae bacterium]
LSLFAHSRVAGVLLLSVIILFGLCLQQKQWLWRHQAAFWIPAVMPSLLWALRNRILWGKWVFSSTSFGYNFYVGFNPVATGSFMPQPPYPPLDKAASMAWDFIRSHPARAVELIAWKLVRFWEISEAKLFGPSWLLWQEWLLMPLGLIASAVGLGQVARHLRSLRIIPFPKAEDTLIFNAVFVLLYFQLFHVVFYVFTPRFRLPVMPIICLLAVWLIFNGWQAQKCRALSS